MSYPYANGIIKVNETKILDKNKLLVLTKYEKEDFVKVLLALNYGKDGNTVEELINNENIILKQLIDSITPCKQDTDLFYLVDDCLMIKLIYKMKVFDLKDTFFITKLSTINYDSLYKAIFDLDYSGLNKIETKLISKLNDQLTNVDDPKTLSAIIDNNIYQYALENAKSSILKQYLMLKIDTTNVMSIFRAKLLNYDFNKFEVMLIDNSKIKKEEFKEIYSLNANEEILKKLSLYYDEKLLNLFKNQNDLNYIQIMIEKYILDEMSKYKDDPFTIGPIVNYYLLKKIEAQNIKLLYNGLENTNYLI